MPMALGFYGYPGYPRLCFFGFSNMEVVMDFFTVTLQVIKDCGLNKLV